MVLRFRLPMLIAMLSAMLSVGLLPQMDGREAHRQLQGRVIDTSGGAIPAIIRVIQQDTHTVVLRFRAQEDGSFQRGSLSPGVYSLTAYSNGFRRHEVRNIVIEAAHVTDLGVITLDLSGCDAPGTNCDYFGEVPDSVKRIMTETYVTLKLGCGVNLDRKNETLCPEQNDAIQRKRSADIRLVRENAILYLVSVSGAQISAAYASNTDCSGVTYGTDHLAVAGLGPGVDFCVTTKRGSVSHVFFTDDLDNQSTAASLWYVTRKGASD